MLPPLRRQFFGFSSLVLLFALLAFVPLPLVYAFDVAVFYNAKEATPLRVIFLVLIITGLFFTFRRNYPAIFLLPLVFVTAGALSNISYRLLFGPVPDYIPLPGSFYANAADGAIFFGILLFFLLSLRLLWQERAWPFPEGDKLEVVLTESAARDLSRGSSKNEELKRIVSGPGNEEV